MIKIHLISKPSKKINNMKYIKQIVMGVVISATCFATLTPNSVKAQGITGTLNNATPMYNKNFGEIVPYNDVFYKFTPTENTTISIELIYTGGVKDFSLSDSLTPTISFVPLEGENDIDDENEGEEDDGIPLQTADTVTKTYNCVANKTYIIRVTDPNGIGGDFTISLDDKTPCNITTQSSFGGNASGDSVYIRGNSCTVYAIPNDCYHFLYWSENDNINIVSDNITYSFNATRSRNLIANFERMQHIIYSFADSIGGSITPTQIVDCSNDKLFEIIPDDCYKLDTLFVDGNVANADNGTYTFTNVRANHSIYASFKKKQYPLAETHNVYGYTMPAGTIDIFCGDTLTYTFVPQTSPNLECELYYILVDGDTIYANQITNNSYTFENITEPHTIFAMFKRITFNVLATADEHSTITPNGNVEVIKGYNCNLAINVTNNCYEIDSVFINGDYDVEATNIVKYTGVYTFTSVIANCSIRVSTKQKEYNLTVFCGQNGAVQSNGNTIAYGADISYLCGANSHLDFVPNATYEVSQVLLDNDDITYQILNNQLNLSSLTGNHSLSVTFKKSPLKLFFFAYGNGKIVYDGCDNNCNMLEVEYNSTPQICFLPENNNYKVGYILVDNDTITASYLTNNCYTLPQVTANHQIKAYFVPSTTYFISAFASANGQIDPSGYLVPVEESESQQFCFYPEEGYVVDFVMIDDVIVYTGDTNCYTIENVMSDHTIYVSFSSSTGIENIEPSFIKIYPNPVDNLLIIESSELKTGEKIDIFDMSGKLAISLTINETNKVTVNVSGLSRGTYVFKIGHIQGKFVKR